MSAHAFLKVGISGKVYSIFIQVLSQLLCMIHNIFAQFRQKGKIKSRKTQTEIHKNEIEMRPEMIKKIYISTYRAFHAFSRWVLKLARNWRRFLLLLESFFEPASRCSYWDRPKISRWDCKNAQLLRKWEKRPNQNCLKCRRIFFLIVWRPILCLLRLH